MGQLILATVFLGIILGIVRAIIHLSFGAGWMYACDAVCFTAWSAIFYSQDHRVIGALLLLVSVLLALSARVAWKKAES